MKFPLELLQRCWFLAGPTAVGKSALSLALARELNGEILSLDSMAIYRHMDIGTAKPDASQQQQVPHHLIDLIFADEEFSTSRYLEEALKASEAIVSRGKTPIFVGGTGLYLRAILRGVFEGPAADWDYRHQLESTAAEQPADWLLSQLQAVDPVTAARFHANDTRRLIRALEIHHLTGIPASQLQQEHPLSEEDRPKNVYWLHPPRDWIRHRIDKRVVQMFEQGLESEVRDLLNSAHPPGRTASQALGYRETIDWIEGRLGSEAETIELIQTRTRQFAKRQHTWFRNLVECHDVLITESETEQTLIEKFLTNADIQKRNNE